MAHNAEKEATQEVLIERVIRVASERPEGFEFLATIPTRLGKQRTGKVTLRGVSPSHVGIKGDNRTGFNVDGTSYITIDKVNGKRFLDWAMSADSKIPSREDFGQPECTFRRCH